MTGADGLGAPAGGPRLTFGPVVLRLSGVDQRRRRTFSFLLPVFGLVITVPELVRLIDARRMADACLERAQTETISCEAGPDVLFLVVAGAFGLFFLARLGFLAYEYLRSQR